MFLSLRRVLPNRYPLDRDVERYIAEEQRLGRMLDYAVIVPRLQRLYEWSAEELAEPRLLELVRDGNPIYAWPFEKRHVWRSPAHAVRSPCTCVSHAHRGRRARSLPELPPTVENVVRGASSPRAGREACLPFRPVRENGHPGRDRGRVDELEVHSLRAVLEEAAPLPEHDRVDPESILVDQVVPHQGVREVA